MTTATLARSPIEYIPRAAPAPQILRVGLAGCGVVGGALVKLLDESSDAIAARHGLQIEIVRVLVRDAERDRGLPIRSDLFTNDIDSFVAEDVDVVIEAIGGEDAAGHVARAALRSGKRFITANKQLIASSGCELSGLARSFAGSLDFGASVGGSAPVISLLRDLLGTAVPVAVRGILNGTSNYVLTQIERGQSFDEALASARRRGLAEADASRDLDGRDAAAKLAIIAWISFGISPVALPIRRIGLPADPTRLIRHATDLGGRIRFIAECVALSGNRVTATVEPVVVSTHSSFGRTELEENRVEVDLGWSAPLCVSGPGAGGNPTATALLGDLLSSVSPRNDRGPVRRVFTPVEDLREHRWLVVADSRSELFNRALADTALHAETVEQSGSDTRARIFTGWNALSSFLSCLRSHGVDASIARLETQSSRVIQ